MKARKVKWWKCPECETLHEEEQEAIDCCPRDEVEQVEAYQCGECEEVYEDRDEAGECCK